MFAKKLISIMEDQGLCQKDLHNLTGIPTPAISMYVGGHNIPSIHRIEVIAKALNVPASALMDKPKPAQRELVLKKISVCEAARRLGKSLDFVRASLEKGTALVDESKPAQRELVLKKVTISEAAHRLGKSLDFVRAALEQGTAPFGFAAKIGDTWSYHISPPKFDSYLRQEGAIK